MKELRIYRPSKTIQSGTAIKWQVVEKVKQKGDKSYSEIMVFVEGAPQTGMDENENASFAWEDRTRLVTLKLGMVDLGELLSVLKGRKDFAGQSAEKGLYHQLNGASKSLQLVFVQGKGYTFRISAKDEHGLRDIKQTLSFSDAELLTIVLEEAVRLYYRG